jgi:hypothetical protein
MWRRDRSRRLDRPGIGRSSKLVRQFEGTMNRAAELIQRLHDCIRPDPRVGKRHARIAAHGLSVPDRLCWPDPVDVGPNRAIADHAGP